MFITNNVPTMCTSYYMFCNNTYHLFWLSITHLNTNTYWQPTWEWNSVTGRRNHSWRNKSPIICHCYSACIYLLIYYFYFYFFCLYEPRAFHRLFFLWFSLRKNAGIQVLLCMFVWCYVCYAIQLFSWGLLYTNYHITVNALYMYMRYSTVLVLYK